MKHVGPVEHRDQFRRELVPLGSDRYFVERYARRIAQKIASDELELMLVEHGLIGRGVAPKRLIELGVAVVESVEQCIDAREAIAKCPVVRCPKVGLVIERLRGRSTAPACAPTRGREKTRNGIESGDH